MTCDVLDTISGSPALRTLHTTVAAAMFHPSSVQIEYQTSEAYKRDQVIVFVTILFDGLTSKPYNSILLNVQEIQNKIVKYLPI